MHHKAREILRAFGQMKQFEVATDRINLEPGPKSQYLIFFTPRSGSSWLTELLTLNAGFGQSEEWFNPDFIPGSARTLGVDNMFDFISLARRRFADPVTGVFGCEVTYFHLEVARELTDVFAHFPPSATRIFYLDRRDTVAQAISLYRAVKTGVFHHNDQVGDRTATVPYDAGEISYWHDHIQHQRCGLEKLFSEHRMNPIRIIYEDMIELGVAGTLDLFSTVLHARRYSGQVNSPASNRKLGGTEQDAWAAQFRAERPGVGLRREAQSGIESTHCRCDTGNGAYSAREPCRVTWVAPRSVPLWPSTLPWPVPRDASSTAPRPPRD